MLTICPVGSCASSMTSSAQPGTRKLGNRKEKISLLQEVTLHTVVSSSLGFCASVAFAALTDYSLAALVASAFCRHAPCRFLYAFTFEEKRQLPLSHACEVFPLGKTRRLRGNCLDTARNVLTANLRWRLSRLSRSLRSIEVHFDSVPFDERRSLPQWRSLRRVSQRTGSHDHSVTLTSAQAGAKCSPRLQRDSRRECIKGIVWH